LGAAEVILFGFPESGGHQMKAPRWLKMHSGGMLVLLELQEDGCILLEFNVNSPSIT
jgi:hypothetical protein